MAGTATPPKVSAVRQRILEAANEMFYAEGIRAISADRIIAAAGVSKVTFYRHFPTKDDLVLAYLHSRSEAERVAIEGMRDAHSDDPCAALCAIARSVAEASCTTGFRGCVHINAAAEYADPTHPVRQAVAAHRRWFAGLVAELLAGLGISDETVVDQLVMLRDGAMISGYLGTTPGTRAETLIAAGRAVIDAAR